MAAKPTRHQEVERKFDVVDAAVSPSFDGLASIARVEQLPAQQLDAVYFDTAEHDLSRNRVTLRRRTGGPDAGWHLKLPAGPDTRTEVRLPLGPDADSATVPDELRDVVLAIVRDQPLVEVARISTVRQVRLLHDADDVAVAEFCDDQVTASPGDGTDGDAAEQRWREWELEVVEGAVADGGGAAGAELLDRLSNRLLDAGAVPAGKGSKLARVLDTASPPKARTEPTDPIHRAVVELVSELIEWDRAVRADTYDSVHQMRVTTRKLRSLLKESEESFGLTDDAWVLDELRQLAAVLGVARDAEVLAEKYEKALDELPAELVRGPVRARLVDGAKHRYEVGLRRSLVAMRTPRYFRLLDALEELASAEPAGTAAGEEPKPVSLGGAYKRVRKAAKNAASGPSEDRDEALHRIRKGAKRLRYTASATGAKEVSEAAKAIQTLLGDHQDAVVSRIHLSQQAEAAHSAGEDTFTYGLLYQQEDDLVRTSREQLAAALKALDKSMK